MTEHARELSELKHEVVEARNQAIKSDNQIKNLILDVRGFERRFDGIERRVRMGHVAVNVIIAACIALSASMLHAMRVQAFEGEIVTLKESVREAQRSAREQTEALATQVTQHEREQTAAKTAAQTALRVLELLDAHHDKEATDLLDGFELGDLTSLERRVCAERFAEAKRRQAESLYRTARRHVAEGHPDAAIPAFRRALVLDPEGRFVAQANYHLAWSLWNTHRYNEAEVLARALVKSGDRNTLDEARYILATSLARLNRTDEARRLLASMIAQESRFSGACRAYSAAMERGHELPQDLPNGRIRFVRRPEGPREPGPAPAAAETPASGTAGPAATPGEAP